MQLIFLHDISLAVSADLVKRILAVIHKITDKQIFIKAGHLPIDVSGLGVLLHLFQRIGELAIIPGLPLLGYVEPLPECLTYPLRVDSHLAQICDRIRHGKHFLPPPRVREAGDSRQLAHIPNPTLVLGVTAHKGRHIHTKSVIEIQSGGPGILHGIVQYAGCHQVDVSIHRGEDGQRFQRVQNIGPAGTLSDCPLVGVHGKLDCLFQHSVIFPDDGALVPPSLMLLPHVAVYLGRAVIKAGEQDRHAGVRVNLHPVGDHLEGDFSCRPQRIAINTGRNGRESDAMDAMRPGQHEGIPIAVAEQFGVLGCAAVHRADGVDDVLCLEAVASRNLCFAGFAAVQGTAFFQQVRAGGPMNGPIHAAPAQQAVVGRIDDALHVCLSDIHGLNGKDILSRWGQVGVEDHLDSLF